MPRTSASRERERQRERETETHTERERSTRSSFAFSREHVKADGSLKRSVKRATQHAFLYLHLKLREPCDKHHVQHSPKAPAVDGCAVRLSLAPLLLLHFRRQVGGRPHEGPGHGATRVGVDSLRQPEIQELCLLAERLRGLIEVLLWRAEEEKS